jgi:hypothetical protein
MCHRYYARHGHTDISFTGIDMAPIAPGGAAARGSSGPGGQPSTSSDGCPDKDMKWRFVQHDMLRIPWPFQDEEFDLVMTKDASLSVQHTMSQAVIAEYLRILRPGGTWEIWEGDYMVRMLRPHVPEPRSGQDDDEEQETAASLGAYVITANTPLSMPLNNYLVEYNGWISKALVARGMSASPCANIAPSMLQEDALTGVGIRRLAVPLSEVRWEREGVGGVVTKDGKSYIETKGKRMGPLARTKDPGKALTAGQAAVRRTALLTVVQLIQNLEPILREVNGKSQDEWDSWQGKMMNDLLRENGTSWGECLEIGAWWSTKKASS